MNIWTVANQKGGVGKTTTTVALGGLLATHGYPTLLLDLDPHGSLSSYFGLDADSVERSSYSLFHDLAEGRDADPNRLLHDTDTPGLALIPASTGLAALDRQSARMRGFGRVIDCALSRLQSRFAQVLIDCPPVLGVLLINALAAADHLLIPVPTDFLAQHGLKRMLRTLTMIKRWRTRPLPYVIVPTFFDQRTRAAQENLAQLQRAYGEDLWDGVIPLDAALRDASGAGVPPCVHQPRSRGARAYGRLLDHLLSDAAATSATRATTTCDLFPR